MTVLGTAFKLSEATKETLQLEPTSSPISKQRTQLRRTIALLLQQDVAMWLESMVPAFKAASPFQDQLLTGVVLCTLLKQVDPDTKARASLKAQKGSYFARDNVAIFLRAWKALAPSSDGFEVNDLVDGKNLDSVVTCLLGLGMN